MKRAYIVLTIFVVIVLVAALSYVAWKDDDASEEQVGGGPGNWKAGDFWQYTRTETGSGIYSGLDRVVYVERYEVTKVNATNLTISLHRETSNYNPSSGDFDVDHLFANYTFASNWTFWGLDYYELIRSSPAVESVGTVSMETEWGTRMAEQYRDYSADEEQPPYSNQDWWFVNGIMVKQTTRTTTTSVENQITNTLTLDTNFPQIVET